MTNVRCGARSAADLSIQLFGVFVTQHAIGRWRSFLIGVGELAERRTCESQFWTCGGEGSWGHGQKANEAGGGKKTTAGGRVREAVMIGPRLARGMPSWMNRAMPLDEQPPDWISQRSPRACTNVVLAALRRSEPLASGSPVVGVLHGAPALARPVVQLRHQPGAATVLGEDEQAHAIEADR